MNSKKSFSARGILILSLLFVFLLSAFAPLPQDPDPSPLEGIAELALGFLSLGGVAALVAAVVSFARSLNWVKDDEQAGRLMATLNLIGFFILVYFRVFRPDLSLDFLDATAATIASILVFVFGLLIQILAPAPLLRLAYQARVPVLGAMGRGVELRAHVVGVEESTQTLNWTTDPEELRRKK